MGMGQSGAGRKDEHKGTHDAAEAGRVARGRLGSAGCRGCVCVRTGEQVPRAVAVQGAAACDEGVRTSLSCVGAVGECSSGVRFAEVRQNVLFIDESGGGVLSTLLLYRFRYTGCPA